MNFQTRTVMMGLHSSRSYHQSPRMSGHCVRYMRAHFTNMIQRTSAVVGLTDTCTARVRTQHSKATLELREWLFRIYILSLFLQDLYKNREHLYRSHLSPVYCSRCGVVFKGIKAQGIKAQTQLDEHIRGIPGNGCENRPLKPFMGISPETKQKLQAKRKRGLTDEEKWIEMYQIILPGEPVPSPCEFAFSALNWRYFNMLNLTQFMDASPWTLLRPPHIKAQAALATCQKKPVSDFLCDTEVK